ncbi:MAG: flagellar hook-length control protein FliK [Woeseiaceae bacterium]|nr:flagellar hook-length control protein FliK [Woeseiaceae bacterium]
MLPTLNLSPGELTSFETLPGSASLVPETADSPVAGFAGMLQTRVAESLSLLPDGGEGLPAGGNALPLEPVALSEDLPALDPEQIVESLNEELEALLPGGFQPSGPVIIEDAVLDDGPALKLPVPEAAPVDPEKLQSVLTPPERPPELREAEPAVTLPVTPARPAGTDVMPVVRSAGELRDLNPDRGDMRNVTATTQLPPTDGDGAPTTLSDVAREQAPVQQAPTRSVEFAQALDTVKSPPPVTTQAVQAGAEVAAAALSTRSAEPASAAVAASPTLQAIDIPVQESGWDRVMSERVLMLANKGAGSAELRLTPAELGPLRVQVSVDDGQATVSFQAQHALTREAIEQALPRLRDMLSENGLTLTNANVSDEGLYQGHREQAQAERGASAGDVPLDDDADTEMVAQPRTVSRIDSSGVDTFV